MPYAQQLPLRRLTCISIDRVDAQSLPELTQAAQNRSLCQLAPQRFPGLGGAEDTVFVQCFPQLEHQR
jgi:hypothetical protein